MRVLNKNKVFYTIMTLLITITLIVICVNVYKDFFKREEKPTVIKNKLDALELYGYTLDDLDTEVYKNYFNELKTILNEEEINEEEYAKIIVKLFVTDFYTLDNKISSSDIGGTEYIHPDMIDNFKMNAGDTIYNHVKTNINGDRDQKLPSVKSVEINSIEEETYTYNENDYDGYKVSATWDYNENLGYEKEGIFYIIKVDNKLYIVEKQEA